MKKLAAAILMSVTAYAYWSAGPAHAADPIKIAVIQDATGSAVLEDYAKQFYRGFDLGIDFATKGDVARALIERIGQQMQRRASSQSHPRALPS